MKAAILAVVSVLVLLVAAFFVGRKAGEEAYYSASDFRGSADGPGVFVRGLDGCSEFFDRYNAAAKPGSTFCTEIGRDEVMERRVKPTG